MVGGRESLGRQEENENRSEMMTKCPHTRRTSIGDRSNQLGTNCDTATSANSSTTPPQDASLRPSRYTPFISSWDLQNSRSNNIAVVLLRSATFLKGTSTEGMDGGIFVGKARPFPNSCNGMPGPVEKISRRN